MIKFHAVKEAEEAEEAVLYFVQDFRSGIYSLLRAKCIDLSLSIDYSTRYFKDVMQYYYCQFSAVSAL